MNRLVALLIALGLAGVAIVVRNSMASGGSESAGRKLKISCETKLESVCRQLGSDVQVTVQDPGSTEATLEKATSKPDIDGWLTPGEWPQIGETARKRAGTQ